MRMDSTNGFRRLSQRVFVSGVSALLLGAVGAGCLTRPIVATQPDTQTDFINNIKQTNIDKVDVLFAIDNSKSMGDKQELLRLAVPKLLGRLLNPQCIDEADKPKGPAVIKGDGSADCSAYAGSRAEFPPVHDLHVGVITSALGPRGSDECRDRKNPLNAALDSHQNDKAQLINRGGAAETAVLPGGSSNYLAWLPGTNPQNNGKPNPGGGVTKFEQEATFLTAFGSLISGVKEYGCGYEAQMESVYRFLVQPDPYEAIETSDPDLSKFPGAKLVGVDNTILKQRKDFLRPDSLVAVIMLTDENESTVDPLALGGRGWVYLQTNHVKGGTTECAADPNSKDCTSCYFVGDGDARCPGGNYLTDQTDAANLRFWDMKRRFGVDPRFPTRRYVEGFRNTSIPDRRGEHPANANGELSADYRGQANCVNPLFAADLPESGSVDTDEGKDALCKLTPGPRSPDQVFFAVIGGVPWQLLTDKPDVLSKSNDGSFKSTLDTGDWLRILGKDPEKFDATGISPYMKETPDKRSDVTSPNDVNSREWETKAADLQYACTFALPTSGAVTQKDCTNPADDACPCFRNSSPNAALHTDSPLCQSSDSTKQIAAKAYPTTRHFQVVKALGAQGIISSICPRTLEGSTEGENFGYNPAVRTIVDRLRDALAAQCLPQKLYDDKNPPADGLAPCLILEQLSQSGGQDACVAADREAPGPAILARYRAAQVESDGAEAAKNQEQFPVCLIPQLTGADLQNGTCENSDKVGWCYVTGDAAGKCSQAIKFTKRAVGKGSKVKLQCTTLAPPVPEN